MIKVQIGDSYAFAWDRIAIRFGTGDTDMGRLSQVAKVAENEHHGAILEYEPYEPDFINGGKPTLCFTDGEARALLEALAAHFGGTGPAKAARDDLQHERGRVDKLTEALIYVATTKT